MDKNKKVVFLDIESSPNMNFIILYSSKYGDILKNMENKNHYRYYDLKDGYKIRKLLNVIVTNKYSVFGFNIKYFDLPVLYYCASSDNLTDEEIHNFANKIIKTEKVKDIYDIIFKTIRKSTYADTLSHIVREIEIYDLFLINNWNNESRRASLKWVSANLRSPNIVEFIPDENSHLRKKEFIKYCINDIKETVRVAHYSRDLIEMRDEVYNMFFKGSKNKLSSSSNTVLGSKLIMLFSGLNEDSISKKKVRYSFNVWDDILLDPVKEYLKNNKDFMKLMKPFVKGHLHRNKEYGVTVEVPNTLSLSGTMTTYSKGGCHGIFKEGIFRSNEEYILYDYDVSGFYPEIAMNYNLYPANIGKAFVDTCHHLKELRKKYPKGTPINKAIKEAMNAATGLSNSNTSSVFFDPQYFFRITINGQLFISILNDMIRKQIPMDVIMFNTDGCVLYLRRSDKEKCDGIMREWEEKYGFTLEKTIYDYMIFEHINEYIAVSSEPYDGKTQVSMPYTFVRDGRLYKVKMKGDMITEYGDIEPHRNTGMRIIAMALYNYFVHGINVADTVLGSKNPYDYCDLTRINKKTKIILRKPQDYISGREEHEEYPYKVMRFIYCSFDTDGAVVPYRVGVNGDTIFNKNNPYVKIVNNIDDFKFNDINFDYYIDVCKKKIEEIEHKTATKTLFEL